MGEKQNNYAMLQGIWMRECGKKMSSGDEVVRIICQNKYKKMWLKISDFFSFLWVTFEKAIITFPLKIF